MHIFKASTIFIWGILPFYSLFAALTPLATHVYFSWKIHNNTPLLLINNYMHLRSLLNSNLVFMTTSKRFIISYANCKVIYDGNLTINLSCPKFSLIVNLTKSHLLPVQCLDTVRSMVAVSWFSFCINRYDSHNRVNLLVIYGQGMFHYS